MSGRPCRQSPAAAVPGCAAVPSIRRSSSSFLFIGFLFAAAGHGNPAHVSARKGNHRLPGHSASPAYEKALFICIVARRAGFASRLLSAISPQRRLNHTSRPRIPSSCLQLRHILPAPSPNPGRRIRNKTSVLLCHSFILFCFSRAAMISPNSFSSGASLKRPSVPPPSPAFWDMPARNSQTAHVCVFYLVLLSGV